MNKSEISVKERPILIFKTNKLISNSYQYISKKITSVWLSPLPLKQEKLFYQIVMQCVNNISTKNTLAVRKRSGQELKKAWIKKM